MKKLLLLLIGMHCFQLCFSQNYQDSLTHKLKQLAQQSTLPGFGVAIVSKDAVLYKNGFGFADLKQKTPYTANSIQNIGSITKTLIAFSLMKLIEEGKIKLDDPINHYLPFKITHPKFPSIPITIRQLATHTSGLTDGKKDMVIEKSYLFNGAINFDKTQLPKDYVPYFKIYQQNQQLTMKDFLYHTYHTAGRWYKKSNFTKKAPGTQYRYTNIGATLLAFIIEEVSQMPFAEYTQQKIMKPLQMTDTYWKLVAIPQNQLTSLYLANNLPIPHYELITYPDGGLFTTVADFASYLQEMIQGLNGESQLLHHASYQEMMSNQLITKHFPHGKFEKSKGLMWSVNPEGDNITMNGADPGIATYTLFTTKGNVGIVIFMNSNLYDIESRERDFRKIRGLLFQYAGKLLKAQKADKTN
ncbi:MAG: serine hydrolase domain-containing protein [Flammeovirgaceae bacterium]